MSVEQMKKYWADPMCTSFTGQVRSVTPVGDNLAVVLEETCFFPEGGGQPADRGTIAGFAVSDVRETSEEIIHTIANSEATRDLLRPGLSLVCEIDRPYRIQNMRLHTTCHVLFGAARLVFNSVNYAGFNISESGSLYLKTDRLIRPDDLRQMTRLANEAVVDQRAIHTWLIPPEEMDSIPGLAVNIRELPDGPIRIVDIEGWDIGACCGTHLPTTLEIGPIKAFNREFHKKNITRIDYFTGRQAVELMAAEENTLGETAEFLGSHRSQVLPMVEKLAGELQSSQKEIHRLKENLMTFQLEKLAGKGMPLGRAILFMEHFDFLDTTGVRAAVMRLLEGRDATLVVISGGTGPLSLAVGCSDDLAVDLRESVVSVVKRFGGGGGGKPNLVSAGDIQTTPDQLCSELMEELEMYFLG
jgi:alanyl-tRNA synthetase